jgi:hypothetical protein
VEIDDVLARTRLARRSVQVCLDGTVAGRLEALQAAWSDAVAYDREHNVPDTAPGVAEEIAALEVEAQGATVTFTVEALGAGAWRRLVAEYPPPPDDTDGWRWDLDTFPPAALAASCIDPKMSEDQATELAERLSNGQWSKLFGAVLDVNLGDDIPKFGPGTAGHPTSAPSSTTAAPEESLTASSSASAASPDPAS